MSAIRVALAVCALLVLVQYGSAAAVIPCGAWAYFYQCDSRWGNQKLGTAAYDTICSAGCAMTSVTMALYKYNTRLYNDITYPPMLNKWLTLNGGYVSGDLIVWDSVRRLGTLGVYGIYTSLTGAQVRSFIHNCYPIVIWVNNRSHFVLVKGYDSANDNILYINDPANRDSLKYRNQVAQFTVYAPLARKAVYDADMPEPNFIPGVTNDTQILTAYNDHQTPIDFETRVN